MVGGILVDAFGWRSVFAFAMAVGGLIAYLAVFESRPPSRATGTGGGANYWTLLRHPRFSAFVLQSGFCTGSCLVAATAASGLMKEMLHRPSTEFGVYFLLFPFRFLSGSFVTSRASAIVPRTKPWYLPDLVMRGKDVRKPNGERP